MPFETEGGINLVEYRKGGGYTPDPVPWASIERQKDVDVCTALFHDIVNSETAKTEGHKHNKLYNGYGDGVVIESPVGQSILRYFTTTEEHYTDESLGFFRKINFYTIENNEDTQMFDVVTGVVKIVSTDERVCGLIKLGAGTGTAIILEDYNNTIALSDTPGMFCVSWSGYFRQFVLENNLGSIVTICIEVIGQS
jgi:hypothetical protein